LGSDDNGITLQLDHLTHRFGRRALFEDLNLTVRSGEWLAITGRNGSGKTTLMRILAGLAQPTRGKAHLLYQDTPLADADRRNALGLVTPDLTLDAELTALENLRFHGRMRGLQPGDEDHLLEEVGLAGRGGDRVKTFSSGMRQRLKYAFALQRTPALLLLDEPTANLDTAGAEIVERVKAAQRERGILVVATNEPREADGATHTLHLGDL
jgi:heme exporter protein A